MCQSVYFWGRFCLVFEGRDFVDSCVYKYM